MRNRAPRWVLAGLGLVAIAAVLIWWLTDSDADTNGPVQEPANFRGSLEHVPVSLGERISFGVVLPPSQGNVAIVLESARLIGLPSDVTVMGPRVQLANENGHFVASARSYPPNGIVTHDLRGWHIEPSSNSDVGLVFGLRAEEPGVYASSSVEVTYSVDGIEYAVILHQNVRLCAPADDFPPGEC